MNNQLELKTWKIGTGISSYFQKILEFEFKAEDFWTIIKKSSLIKIIEIGDKYSLIFDFDRNQDIYCAVSLSTINQFLRLTTYWNITNKINEKCYRVSDEFISHIINNTNSNKTTKQLISEFILGSISYRFGTLSNWLIKYQINDDNSIPIEDSDISFSFLLSMDKLYYKEKEEYEYLTKEINRIRPEFKSIKESEEGSGKYFGPLLEEIGNSADNISLFNAVKTNIRNLLKAIRRVKKLPSLECEEILQVNISKNKLIVNKNAENNSDNSYSRNQIECNFRSSVHNIYELFSKCLKNIKVPIFQRKYVWNIDLIKNMIDSIDEYNEDCYLNNIILTSKINETSFYTAEKEIIDGQQRIFTIILILFSIYKILVKRWLNKNNKFIIKNNNQKLLFNMFTDPTSENFFAKIYSNLSDLEDGNIYKYLNSLLMDYDFDKNEECNYKNKILILKIIEILNKMNDLDTFLDKILTKTYASYTNIKVVQPEVIFQNLNLNSKPLSSLDLFRNYLYSKTKDERLIKKFNEEFYNIFLKKDEEVDEKDISVFASLIYRTEVLNERSKKMSHTSITNNYVLLKEWFENENDKNNINFHQSFDSLLLRISLYKFIKNPKVFLKEQRNSNLYTKIQENKVLLNDKVIEQIFAANQEQTVFIPLVWTLLEKFKVLYNKKNIYEFEGISDLFKWLFELERFIFVWKWTGFSGDSLTESIYKIIKDINNKNIMTTEQLKNRLKSTVPEIKKFEKEAEIDEQFNKSINNFFNYPQKLDQKLRTLLLSRIHFNLSIGEYRNGFVNIDEARYKNYLEGESYSLWADSKYEYEHCLAQKSDLIVSFQKGTDEYEKAQKYIKMIGNGCLLQWRANVKASNKIIEKKYDEYKNTPKNNISLYGFSDNDGNEKNILLTNILDWNPNYNNNKPLKLQEYYKKIEERTKQLLKIIFDIYKYDKNSIYEFDETKNI